MVEKLILLVTRELADEKHRPLVIGILLAPLFLIAVIVLLVVGAFSFFTVTLGTFLTEDTSLVGETVAVMDKAREAYVEEQMDLYRQRVDRNGKPYRNVVLQWENGFSNNDKEILTIVSCYYEQDWEIDMADLASWAVLKSISFSTRERGPYSCGGCRSRKVCDGHPDGNGGTYHHSDDAADCDNYHTVTYCPGDHYDLYVTATLPGCQTWNDEAGATEQTIARWDDLVDLSYTGSSAVMQQYQQAVRMATLNEDWEGWTELNIEWSKVLFQTDWEELYGVTVTQVGITDSGSYTPDDSFTGNLPGSGNGTFILPLASYSYISCHFGEADGWTGAPHGGMDFAAGYGTPIYAAADGVVVKAGWHNSWGNYVKIYHGTDAQGNKIYTLYAHASSLAATAGQRDPVLRSMYEEYLDSQKELVLTYASNEETLDKKFAEIENSFFHPYCGFEDQRAGRAEVTRHNIIIQAAERYAGPTVRKKPASHSARQKSTSAQPANRNGTVSAHAAANPAPPHSGPAVQEKPASHGAQEKSTPEQDLAMNTQPADSDEKVDGSDYREKSPGYAAQNMLYRLAKTLRFDQQQAQIRNRAHQAANGLTGEKQNVRRLKTGLADERNLSSLER